MKVVMYVIIFQDLNYFRPFFKLVKFIFSNTYCVYYTYMDTIHFCEQFVSLMTEKLIIY